MKKPGTTTRRNGTVRCAIYTRKSSEEGLEQEFNSLQAQREACEAFIDSQRHEGWRCLRAAYDDGGFSGATMDRPALQQLLADITAGRVDNVVVYKIDRLTRSLADFAKIVEILDAKGASFVSVTQQFNTTTVREGKAEALMKGSLHTDELMGAVVARETGIRTARRISHCFVMDVPGHKDPLIITDAAVNIAPSLADKVDIVQNAIDLCHALRFQGVRVAIMSAMETVNPAVPSTIEAAALCKMAERGQITGGILDGPLALDNAINEEAAAIKHIVSPVAGRANVLVVPDLESGNMLAKSLSFLAGAAAAGIVLGARVPIILTSRADSVITRLASCAVASLVADARRKSAAAAIR
ncbi:MAG TPA: bifunctional enoyl-CoA hydratase/phosphate acetyltransferase [Xanthobacteraceae bacterium]|nr:bifunctional enoyl-CoA hydratase/phosphate acetyltransferase [Xanthobacteraceae bacterium]